MTLLCPHCHRPMPPDSRPGSHDPLLELTLATVSRAMQVSPELLLSSRRSARVARARHVVWALLRRADWSLTDIARPFARHHTTVLAGLRYLDNTIHKYPEAVALLQPASPQSGVG